MLQEPEFILIKSATEQGRETPSSSSAPVRYLPLPKLNIVPAKREMFIDSSSDITEQSKKGNVRAENQDSDNV